MATRTTMKSTKGELLTEITRLRKVADDIDKFKKKVAIDVVECIDEYGVDVCDEGLDEFFRRIGTERPAQVKPATITLVLGDIELPTTRNNSGSYDFDSDDLVDSLADAVNAVLYKHGSGEFDNFDISSQY